MNMSKMHHRHAWIRGLSVLILVFLVLGMTGCKESAGYTSLDTKGQHAIWIRCDWAADTDGQVSVRRLVYSKEAKEYVLDQEYTVTIGEDRNNFGLVVDQQGLYEITLSANGYEPQTRMLDVDSNQVYCITIHMPPL